MLFSSFVSQLETGVRYEYLYGVGLKSCLHRPAQRNDSLMKFSTSSPQIAIPACVVANFQCPSSCVLPKGG